MAFFDSISGSTFGPLGNAGPSGASSSPVFNVLSDDSVLDGQPSFAGSAGGGMGNALVMVLVAAVAGGALVWLARGRR